MTLKAFRRKNHGKSVVVNINPFIGKRVMLDKYLIDTSVWVDLYEDRKGYRGEPLGDFAFKLITVLKARRNRIVLTDFLIRELEVNYSLEEIRGLLKVFEDVTETLIATREQRDEAKRIARARRVPPGDALHAIVARDHRLVLVTRDKHFRSLQDIWPHQRPEELI